jgi:uncharacterized Ntn-hydrolase superfamily protein
MTFSLVARCARTGQVGMVISSSSPAVAARCVHVRAGVGAVASQNVTDPALGPLVLDRLAAGMGADAALQAVTAGRPHIDYRQLLVVDRDGATAIHSGGQVLGVWGEARGTDCAAGGNLLATPGIPAAMVAGFEAATGHLGERLMQALEAGLKAGGEAGPVRSAGLTVADRLTLAPGRPQDRLGGRSHRDAEGGLGRLCAPDAGLCPAGDGPHAGPLLRGAGR